MSFDAFASQGGSAPASTPDTSAPAPVTPDSGTAAPATPPPASVTPPAHTGDPGTAPVQPEWSPNFKFKVMEQDHEMDPYFQQFVKTKEDEAKFREIYEKAYGLDVVKPKFQAAREELQKMKPEYTSLMGQIGELRDHYSRGDFDTFFQKLQIPEQKILQWVLDKAQYNQLPSEQRKVLDDKRMAESKTYELEKKLETFQSQYEAQVSQAKAQGLQIALEKPDVNQIASQYDAKKGAGSFRQKVIEVGQSVWVMSQGKVDLTPDQAVKMLMDDLTLFAGQQSGSQPPVIPAVGSPQGMPQKQKPLPNLSGRNTSQVGKPKVKSLADLKKLAEQMAE